MFLFPHKNAICACLIILGYAVIREGNEMRIIGIRFFSRLF
jgi:hypothetical protein